MSDESEGDNDYAVGYGRPPTGSQFKPGQSGNPRGRPRGSRSVASILNEVMNRKVSVTENGKVRRVTAIEAMMRRLLNESLHGDKAAAKIMLPLFERYAETAEGAARTEDLLVEDREVLARFMRASQASSAENSRNISAVSGADAEYASKGDEPGEL